ncbi:MAG: hypothetical protein H6832_10665 [Planctomycetes bacterium]|nr:hypothetical protein [Planctomycetota bacterium]MCB9918851.1 hypothetical protein [Planctomycetota bacterium]
MQIARISCRGALRRRVVCSVFLIGSVFLSHAPRAMQVEATQARNEASVGDDFESLVRYLRPAPRAEEDIAWRATFGAAIREASQQKKPVLLWAMNGHPLGCT